MKKWMVVVALLATAQVGAQKMSIAKGMTPFDDRWNDVKEDHSPHYVATAVYEIYVQRKINLATYLRVIKEIKKYQKMSIQDGIKKTQELYQAVRAVRDGRMSERQLIKIFDLKFQK